MKKRLLAMLLCVLMIVGLLPVMALAATYEVVPQTGSLTAGASYVITAKVTKEAQYNYPMTNAGEATAWTFTTSGTGYKISTKDSNSATLYMVASQSGSRYNIAFITNETAATVWNVSVSEAGEASISFKPGSWTLNLRYTDGSFSISYGNGPMNLFGTDKALLKSAPVSGSAYYISAVRAGTDTTSKALKLNGSGSDAYWGSADLTYTKTETSPAGTFVYAMPKQPNGKVVDITSYMNADLDKFTPTGDIMDSLGVWTASSAGGSTLYLKDAAGKYLWREGSSATSEELDLKTSVSGSNNGIYWKLNNGILYSYLSSSTNTGYKIEYNQANDNFYVIKSDAAGGANVMVFKQPLPDIADCTVDSMDKTYNGQSVAPVVKNGTTTLTLNTAYTVTYYPNVGTVSAPSKGTALTAAPSDAGNYIATFTGKDPAYQGTKDVPFTISPKALTASVTHNLTRNYNGTADWGAITTTVNTGITGQSLTISGVTGTFDNANAGTNKTVNVDSTNMTVTAGSRTNANNYTVTVPTTTTGTINKLNITVTAGNQTVAYEEDINTEISGTTASVTSGSLVSGQKLTGKLTPSTENVTNNGTLTPTDVKVLDAEDNDVTGNYNITTSTGKLTITAIDMTYTSVGYTGVYDGAAHGITLTVTKPEDATIKYRTVNTGSYGLTTAPTFTNAGTYTVYYQITDRNFNTATGSETVTISPKFTLETAGNEINGYSFTIDGTKATIAPKPAEGFYNVVIEYGDRTVTEILEVKADAPAEITLPVFKNGLFTSVGIQNGLISAIGNLDNYANNNQIPRTGDRIDIDLTVEFNQDAAAEEAIKNAAGENGKRFDFFNITIKKKLNNRIDGYITDTTIAYPIQIVVPTGGRTVIGVYCYHGGSAIAFTESDSGRSGTYKVAGDNVIIYSSSFSTYAVVYENATVIGYEVIAPETTENGRLTVSTKFAAVEQEVTLTAVPDAGRSVYSISVKGQRSGNAVALTDNGNGVYVFKMPAENVVVTVSFDCTRDASCPIEKYTDTANDYWWHDGIHFCLENGLMNGTSDTTFEPLSTTDRAMVVTILWRLEGCPTVDYAMTFKDVEDGQWYTEAVRWAQSTGIVKGYNDDVFGPFDPILREQAAAIIYRYAQYKGVDINSYTENTNTLSYEDIFDVDEYAASAMHFCLAAHLLQGDDAGYVKPIDPCLRAQIACMVQRFAEQIINWTAA